MACSALEDAAPACNRGGGGPIKPVAGGFRSGLEDCAALCGEFKAGNAGGRSVSYPSSELCSSLSIGSTISISGVLVDAGGGVTCAGRAAVPSSQRR